MTTPTELDNAELDRLEGLYAAAPGGQWEFDGPPEDIIIWGGQNTRVCFMTSNGAPAGTVAFITEAHNAFPALIAAARSLPSERRARENAERERDEARALLPPKAALEQTLTDPWHFAYEQCRHEKGVMKAELEYRLSAAEARATTAETEAASLRERVKALEARLEESIYGEMMAAYHVGVERDGKWMDCARSEGEWLRGELGVTEPGWHDAETIKAMIPEAARRSARATLEEKNND